MLVDARGVEIAPGDTAIWGFGVGRSVAMAEGVVVGEEVCEEDFRGIAVRTDRVSLTPKGRVRVRVVRRSYDSGEKPVIDVAPDRLIVLKLDYDNWSEMARYRLPPSPLPTQAEVARVAIEKAIERYTASMKEKVAPTWMERMPFPVDPAVAEKVALAEYLGFCARELEVQRRKLRAIDG